MLLARRCTRTLLLRNTSNATILTTTGTLGALLALKKWHATSGQNESLVLARESDSGDRHPYEVQMQKFYEAHEAQFERFKIFEPMQESMLERFAFIVAVVCTAGLAWPLWNAFVGLGRYRRAVEEMSIDGRKLALTASARDWVHQQLLNLLWTFVSGGIYLLSGAWARSDARFVQRHIVWADELPEDQLRALSSPESPSLWSSAAALFSRQAGRIESDDEDVDRLSSKLQVESATI
jgi:hypothetical protein